MEEDEMDSLFEGMELFTPSQLVHEKEECEHAPLQSQSRSQSEFQSPIATDGKAAKHQQHIATDASTADLQQQLPVPEPLDENLFSDLTIVTPLQTLTTQSDSFPTPTVSSFSSSINSRHSSRKKKRAAGLRIGYGRDYSSFDDVDAPSRVPSSPPTALPTPDHNPQSKSLSQSHSSSLLPAAANHDDGDDNEDDHDHPIFGYDRQFQLVKDQISDKLGVAQELVASASAARKDSIRRRRKGAQDLNLASSNHSILESQLEDACEAEDFERAERISESLATAEKEKQALLFALREAEALCVTIDYQMLHALDCQIAAEQDCASLLCHFAKDARQNADSIFEKAEASSSKETHEWFSSTEALEGKKIELDIESHFIKEARLAVNDSIQYSIKDPNEEREILRKKKDMLTDELHKLVILVKQKELEIAENDAKIKAVEQRIADVVGDFEGIQSNIDATYNKLQSDLAQMHLQSGALSTKRQEIDQFLNEEQERGTKLRQLAMVSEDEARDYQEVVEMRKNLQVLISKSKEDKVKLGKIQEKLTEEIQMLQREASAARASQQELSLTKSSVQQTISSFKQRILFIDKRVPELEAEKKVAAAARNFKEAARIAAEAKSLSIEKEGVQMDLEKATLELEKLEEGIKDTVSRLHDIEGLISSREKEVAMARFQQLLLIAGEATAERIAALELGDNEEADLLLAEAEAASAEAKKLQPMYNFEEEFSNLSKHFISVELVSKLGRKQLAQLTALADFPTSA